MEEIIKLWKELNVDYVNFNFYCGGDSMGDTTITIHDKSGTEIESDELENYFDSEIYHKVNFYVNSDGHYQGESGNVRIELSDEEDDDFYYSKDAQSEYNESVNSEVKIPLNEKQIKFVKDNVSNINGGDGNVNVNFKRDFIMTNEEEDILLDLETTIDDFIGNFEPEEYAGELNDWTTYTTDNNDNGEDLKIDDAGLTMFIDNSTTVYVDSE